MCAKESYRKSILNIEDRENLANIVGDFWVKIKEVYNETFGEISKIIGKNPEYLTRLRRQILNGHLIANKYIKNFRSWYKVLRDGLEQEKRQEIITFCNSHIEQIVPYCKLELLFYYNHCKDSVEYNNWNLITFFNNFSHDILKGKVNRVGDYPFEIWCGVNGHENCKKVVYGKNLGQCNYYCHLCSPHGQSIKYDEILLLSFSNGYELKNPSSEKDWVKMILFNKTNKLSPTNIAITLVCEEHGDFPTTYNRLHQGHHCPKCRLLSVDEIKKRGLEFGLELVTPLNQVRSKIENLEPLEWICIRHKVRIKSLPYISEFERHYCQKCSNGEITYERAIRYLLNKMFFDKFGCRPMPIGQLDGLQFSEIIKNNRIERFLSKNAIKESNYNKSHFDCFGFIKIDKIFKVVVEVWGPQHKNLKNFLNIYPKRTLLDYKRMKNYDTLRSILREEGFLDIFIIIPLYKFSRYKFQDFIIKEFNRQLLENFGIKYNRIFPRFSWTNLLKEIRFAKDYQDLQGYL